MKTSRFFTKMMVAAGIVLAGNIAIAQEVAMPGGFQQHGNNSSGTPAATEATDSVTVGAVLQYWAEPDALVSPNGVFTWTVTGVGSQTAGGTTNLATVTFGAAPATGTIAVVEGDGTCADATPISIDVEVIAAPTATFGADPAPVCTNNPVQTFTLPMTLSTAVQDGLVRINYTVYNPDNSVLIAAQDANYAEATASFDVTLTGATQYGTYYVVINTASDRISRKSSVAGVIADNQIDLVVNRTPVTGPIFHLPNN